MKTTGEIKTPARLLQRWRVLTRCLPQEVIKLLPDGFQWPAHWKVRDTLDMVFEGCSSINYTVQEQRFLAWDVLSQLEDYRLDRELARLVAKEVLAALGVRVVPQPMAEWCASYWLGKVPDAISD